ncbi:MAG: hypothetical protein QOG94_1344 [Solirubrobacteraceae bacterium]|jgi:hypothetical protein|nr:hypothetical protein [Solirubrobacteraceae bacterium]MEA2139680.1 hypothetical protein [Solirubrobacteraceae bacterium]
MSDVPSAGSGQDRLLELRASAKGWHGVQMAVLGFIGLCGVLQRDDAGDPTWLQVWALLLAVAALLTALWAIVLVGRAAWPLYGPQPELPSELDYEARLRVASRQLSRGLALTFVSVALLALGTASAWWPSSVEAGLVEVQAASGQRVCGALADAPHGELHVVSGGSTVRVALQDVSAVRAVGAC